MGGRCSRHVTYRHPVPFVSQMYLLHYGCIGLTDDMYNIEQQLTAGPGLVIPFYGKSMDEMITLSQVCIKALASNKLKEFIEQTSASRPTKFKATAAEKRLSAQTGANVQSSQQDQSATEDSNSNANTDKGPDFAPYDERADFEKRLKDLLRRLDKLDWLQMLMDDYDQRIEEKQRMENSDLPPSVRAVEEKTSNVSSTKITTPQLPPLPAPKPSAQGGSDEELIVFGPAYMLLSNDADSKYIEAYMFFPSITSDIRTSPNYDFLGRSHQWLNRLITDDIYIAKGAGCEQSCYGTPKYLTQKKRGRCDKDETMYACGCRTDNPKRPACYHDPPKRKGDFPRMQYKKKKGTAPILYQYVIYKINQFHPTIKNAFHKDSPTELMTNIISSDWNVFPGCKYSMMSRNGRFHSRFETIMAPIPGTQRGRTMMYQPTAQFGVFYNVSENIKELCKKRKVPQKSKPVMIIRAPGYPVRVTIERNMLNLYTSEKQQVIATGETLKWSIQIASDDAKPPFSMVLLDSGKFDVFDRENKSVITPKFANYVEAAISSNNTQQSNLPEFVPTTNIEGEQEYDPEKEYQRRLENLRDWLRARNLLVEVVSQVYDLNSVQVIQATGGEVGEFTPFDPNVDYAKRFNKLLQLVKEANIPFLPIDEKDPTVVAISRQNNYDYSINSGNITMESKRPAGGISAPDYSSQTKGQADIVIKEDDYPDENDYPDVETPRMEIPSDQSFELQQKMEKREMQMKMNERMDWFKNSSTAANKESAAIAEILFDSTADYERRLGDLKRLIGAISSN